MDRTIIYILAAVLAIFIGWQFYVEGKQDAEFTQKIAQIENARKVLEDSIVALKAITTIRDEKLRAVIVRDMEIMDTLNVTLKRLNSNSKAIENKIDTQIKTLDDLWNDNEK